MKWLSKKNKCRVLSIAVVISLLIIYFVFSAFKLVFYLGSIGLLIYFCYRIFKMMKAVKKTAK